MSHTMIRHSRSPSPHHPCGDTLLHHHHSPTVTSRKLHTTSSGVAMSPLVSRHHHTCLHRHQSPLADACNNRDSPMSLRRHRHTSPLAYSNYRHDSPQLARHQYHRRHCSPTCDEPSSGGDSRHGKHQRDGCAANARSGRKKSDDSEDDDDAKHSLADDEGASSSDHSSRCSRHAVLNDRRHSRGLCVYREND